MPDDKLANIGHVVDMVDDKLVLVKVFVG